MENGARRNKVRSSCLLPDCKRTAATKRFEFQQRAVNHSRTCPITIIHQLGRLMKIAPTTTKAPRKLKMKVTFTRKDKKYFLSISPFSDWTRLRCFNHFIYMFVPTQLFSLLVYFCRLLKLASMELCNRWSGARARGQRSLCQNFNYVCRHATQICNRTEIGALHKCNNMERRYCVGECRVIIPHVA